MLNESDFLFFVDEPFYDLTNLVPQAHDSCDQMANSYCFAQRMGLLFIAMSKLDARQLLV